MTRYNRKNCLFFCLLLLLGPLSDIAAEDQKILLRVGIGRLAVSDGISQAVSGGISNNLLDEIQDVDSRRLTADEIVSLLIKDKEKDLKNKKLELDKLLTERDDLLFDSARFDFEEKYQKKQLDIAAKNEDIDKLAAEIEDVRLDVDMSSYSIIPIELAKSGSDGGFYDSDSTDPAGLAEADNLDLLIYGSISKLEEYNLIELKIWNRLLGRNTFEWVAAAELNNVNEELKPGYNAVRTAILGREWAGVEVKSSENSMIYIDEKFVGIERYKTKLLEPGPHTVKVKKPGWQDVSSVVSLQHTIIEELTLESELKPSRRVVVQTFPDGADVYIDSVWAGTTPLELDIESFPLALRLKRQGYEDKQMFLDDEGDTLININMKPSKISGAGLIDAERNRFYTSLGIFILSLPVSFIMYGEATQAGLAYETEYNANGYNNYSEILRLYNDYFALNACFYASLGLNFIMFFDTIVQAVEYIGSVDYASD